MLRDHVGDSLPIVVPTQLDFLYLLQYRPSLAPRPYTVSDSAQDLQYRLYHALRTHGGASYSKEETYSDLFPSIETLHFGYGYSLSAKVHMGPQ